MCARDVTDAYACFLHESSLATEFSKNTTRYYLSSDFQSQTVAVPQWIVKDQSLALPIAWEVAEKQRD